MLDIFAHKYRLVSDHHEMRIVFLYRKLLLAVHQRVHITETNMYNKFSERLLSIILHILEEIDA